LDLSIIYFFSFPSSRFILNLIEEKMENWAQVYFFHSHLRLSGIYQSIFGVAAFRFVRFLNVGENHALKALTILRKLL